MRDPNEVQVGGTHYKTAYQHWDFMADITRSPEYYVGCATKYLVRWRGKNGLQDLEKAVHYIEKLCSLYVTLRINSVSSQTYSNIHRDFCAKLIAENKVPQIEGRIIEDLVESLFHPPLASVALGDAREFLIVETHRAKTS